MQPQKSCFNSKHGLHSFAPAASRGTWKLTISAAATENANILGFEMPWEKKTDLIFCLHRLVHVGVGAARELRCLDVGQADSALRGRAALGLTPDDDRIPTEHLK